MNTFFDHAQLPEYVPLVPASSHNLAGWRSALTDTHGYELAPSRSRSQTTRTAYPPYSQTPRPSTMPPLADNMHPPAHASSSSTLSGRQPSTQQPCGWLQLMAKAERDARAEARKLRMPRTSKACDECHKNKRKCTGGVRCERCERQKLSCSYTDRKAKKAKEEKGNKPVMAKQRAQGSGSNMNINSPFSAIWSSSDASNASSLDSRRSSMASAASYFSNFGFPEPDSRWSSMAGPARTRRRPSRSHPYSGAAPSTVPSRSSFDPNALANADLFCGPTAAHSSNLDSLSLFTDSDFTNLLAELGAHRVVPPY